MYLWRVSSNSYSNFQKNPQIIDSLKEYNIKNIKCGATHFCISTDNNLYFMFGGNKYNECLKKYKIVNDNVSEPYLVNNIVSTKTDNKYIKDVYLGNHCTILKMTDTK